MPTNHGCWLTSSNFRSVSRGFERVSAISSLMIQLLHGPGITLQRSPLFRIIISRMQEVCVEGTKGTLKLKSEEAKKQPMTKRTFGDGWI